MRLVVYTTATVQIDEAEAASKFLTKAGVITVSTADTLPVLFWDATLDSKHVDCLNG